MKQLSKAKNKNIKYTDAKKLFENFSIRFNLSKPVKSFTGREEILHNLHSTIQENAQRPTVISQVITISGLGGIGKTQLAKKYIETYSSVYEHNIVWISSETDGTLSNDFKRLAKDKLGIDLLDRNIKSIIEDIYTFFLNKKVLFVFDNCTNTPSFRSYLPINNQLQQNDHLYILMTSRDRNWCDSVTVTDLTVLTLEEAVFFIKKELNVDDFADYDIKELALTLQCLPLVLQQAISYIKEQRNLRTNYNIKGYLSEFKTKAERTFKSKEFMNRIDSDYSKTTFVTWLVTLDQIKSDETHGELAMKILKTIIYIYSDEIQRSMFLKLANDDEYDLYQSVNLLVRYSIINGKQNQSIIDIHRMVQHVVRFHEKNTEKSNLRNTLELLKSLDADYHVHKAFVWAHACNYDDLIDEFIVENDENNENKITFFSSVVASKDFQTLNVVLKYIREKRNESLRSIVNKPIDTTYNITCLHTASAVGFIEIVKLLVENDADVNLAVSRGETPLRLAARGGHVNVMHVLIEKGANMKEKDKKGNTLIHLAAKEGQGEVIKFLLVKNVDANLTNAHKETPLHLATRRGHLNVMHILIDNGADMEARDEYGNTLIHEASFQGHAEVVKLLYTKNINVDLINNNKETPLHLAVRGGYLNVIYFLISNGADMGARDEEENTLIHTAAWTGQVETIKFLLTKNADVNLTNIHKETPLHLATRRGHLNVVHILTDNGADIKARNIHENTPIHEASSEGHLEIVELLLSKNTDLYLVNINEETPLHLAAHMGHVSIINLLINKGFDMNARNKHGNTLVHIAAYQNQAEVIKFLLAKGTDVNLPNYEEETPLHLAVRGGHLNVIHILIENDVDLKARDKDGDTPIHQASFKGQVEVVKLLLIKITDVNLTNNDEETPLHMAARGGHRNVMHILIDKGFDIKARNKYGDTLLHLAAWNGDVEVVEFLMAKGVDVNLTNNDGETPLQWAARGNHLNVMHILTEECEHRTVAPK